MPAKSAKQERFMQAVARNPKFAKAAGVPQSVGKEFTKSKGGEMKESKATVKKEIDFMKKKGAPKSMIKYEEKEMPAFKKGGVIASKMGSVKTAAPSRDGVAVKGKTKGKQIVMKKGGKC